MTDEQFEIHLRKIASPVLPDAWRESILSKARRTSAPPPRATQTWPALLLYLRRLFVQNPITAGALTTLWILALLLKAGTPADPAADRFLAQLDPHHPLRLVSLNEEIRLAEALQDDPPPERQP